MAHFGDIKCYLSSFENGINELFCKVLETHLISDMPEKFYNLLSILSVDKYVPLSYPYTEHISMYGRCKLPTLTAQPFI